MSRHGSPREELPLDEATLELRTLRITVPMRQPAPNSADADREAPMCRTTLLRLPPSGPISPCHPDALAAASARPAITRQRGALVLVILLGLFLVPLAVRAVWGLFRAPAAISAPTPAPEALRSFVVSSTAPSTPSTEPSASTATPNAPTPSALPAPLSAPSSASSTTFTAPRPVRRTPAAPKPRPHPHTDIVDPWGD